MMTIPRKPDSTICELSVVIPVFNEGASLEIFLRRLYDTLAATEAIFEVWVVDDGSKDDTWQKLESLFPQRSHLKALRFTRNFGKEAAILAGIRKASGRAVVVIDGDGQHPPELICQMLRLWRAGEADIIAARKATRRSDPISARLSAWLFNTAMRTLTGLDLASSSDFRLMDRRVVDTLLSFPEKTRFFRGMTTWTGFRQLDLLFDVPARIAGASKWKTSQLLHLAISSITSYSAKPLGLVFKLGLAGMLIALILLVQALYSWFANIAISGWTSLTLVILFFGSANLLGIGLVGAYLAQIFDEIKARPEYLIDKERP